MNDPGALPVINAILLTLISVGVVFTQRTVASLRNEVKDLNSIVGELSRRLAQIEAFREAHETWCRDRDARNEREHGEMRASVDYLSRKEKI